MKQPLFIGGTASHVGKSWFATAFCRLLRRRGARVAPFKAQNMSNNSYPCIEGGEIGRAQAVQAEACGLPPMADMNPVLLKPNSATGSQVVVCGKVWAEQLAARSYYEHSDELFGIALESFARLRQQFPRVVCEGAGSVAEVNLRERDITNLRFAERVGAKAVLVADIERGGVFASLVGTMELLPAVHRDLVQAFAVNRFRGDVSLFDGGVRFLEERLGIPCLGVFPFDREIEIDEEDSLGIAENASGGAEIAVLRLPRISNFTDFRGLAVDWVDAAVERRYRVVILPGTKNTLADMQWMQAAGLYEWVKRQKEDGALVLGICGGYQILGESVCDGEAEEKGLGMCPVRTVMRWPKVTRAVKARTPNGVGFEGYEIHMGETSIEGKAKPFAYLEDGREEGYWGEGVMGTYLHGALENPAVAAEYLGIAARAIDKDSMYERLADWLEAHSRRDVLESLLT